MNVTELSPLLHESHVSKKTKTKDGASNAVPFDASGGAIPSSFAGSYFGTLLNIMKTCMGTGCLALPYACQQGGIVLFIFGLLLIASWNLVAMHQLIDCLSYLPVRRGHRHRQQKGLNVSSKSIDGIGSVTVLTTSASESLDQPPIGTSTMGVVAWYAFGTQGLRILDCVIVVLFVGIITAYVAAVVSFMSDTPFSVNRWFDAIVAGVVMGTFAIVPDIGYLSGASGLGLIILFSAFVVIAGYGMVSLSTSNVAVSHPASPGDDILVWWPSSLGAVSHWYGIAVFGYGVVPLTYNFQESMNSPEKIIQVSATALTCVALSYFILGVGLYTLFPHLTSDVLHELPKVGIVPIITRCAMVGTILSTGPLLIVPCAEVVRGRLYCGKIAEATFEATASPFESLLVRASVRYGVVGLCVVVAIVLPNFVEVLALVGCFCVAFVSFCVPPALHLRLMYLTRIEATRSGSRIEYSIEKSRSYGGEIADVVLLLFGIAATIVSTISTLTN
jgi:amino acid permease